jgi:hypothetical protein
MSGNTGYTPVSESWRATGENMTDLLKKAFEQAARLPDGVQDEVARQLLEDIEGELLWDDTLARSQDKLEEMADRALQELRAGRTRRAGFDEL